METGRHHSRTKRLLQNISPRIWCTRHGGDRSRRRRINHSVLRRPVSHYKAMEPSETKVRIYGKTAVCCGTFDVSVPGESFTYRTRTLEV